MHSLLEILYNNAPHIFLGLYKEILIILIIVIIKIVFEKFNPKFSLINLKQFFRAINHTP